MSFHFVLFYVCRLCLHLLFFKIYFIFLVACGIKPTSTCFHVLSSSPTQGGAAASAIDGRAKDISEKLPLPFQEKIHLRRGLTASV